jgi:hypothetical protein
MYPYDTMYPGAGYGGYGGFGGGYGGGYGAGYGGYGAGYGTGYGAYGTGYGGYGYDPAMDLYDPYEMDTMYSGGYDPYGYGGGFSRYGAGGMYGSGFPYTPSYYPRRGGLFRSRSVGSIRRRGLGMMY